MGKNPERSGLLSPEDTGIGIRDRETDRNKESAEAAVPSKRHLLQNVDWFVETKDNTLIG
jgi:hypothetical protein